MKDEPVKPAPPQADTPIKGAGEKVAVFYCENGKSLEGLEQGALAVLSNLMMKTNATTAEFMIGNEKDGEFYFTCSRTKSTPAPIDAEVRERKAASEALDKCWKPRGGQSHLDMQAAWDFVGTYEDAIRAALKKGG